MNNTADRLHRRLPELVAAHGVAGAQVAVLADGEIHDAAAGTLVMQLVHDGLLDTLCSPTAGEWRSFGARSSVTFSASSPGSTARPAVDVHVTPPANGRVRVRWLHYSRAAVRI